MVFELSASRPTATLSDAVVEEPNASKPTATLSSPDVASCIACVPIIVLAAPLILSPAKAPTATLLLPLFAVSAAEPIAVL